MTDIRTAGVGGLLEGANLRFSPQKKKQLIANEFPEKNQRANCRGGGGAAVNMQQCSYAGADGSVKGSKRRHWTVCTPKKTWVTVPREGG